MTYLAHITADDLRQVLAEVEGKTPTQRVLAGISYKDGVAQTTIAERYGVHRNTVRNWLERLERLAIVIQIISEDMERGISRSTRRRNSLDR